MIKFLYLQTQTPLAGIFQIDRPVNVHINVINTVENDILKELSIFDDECKDENSTNSTSFEEVSNVTSILSNDTMNDDDIETTAKNKTNINADRTIQINLDKQNQKKNSTIEGIKLMVAVFHEFHQIFQRRIIVIISVFLCF